MDLAYEYEIQPPKPEELVFAILSFIAILSNSLIIWTISKNRNIQSKRNILILNWAISDLITNVSNQQAYKIFFHLFGVKMTVQLEIFEDILESLMINFYLIELVFVTYLFIDYFYDRFSVELIHFFWIFTFVLIVPGVAGSFFGFHLRVRFISELIIYVNFAFLLISFIVKILRYFLRRIQRKPHKIQLRFILSTFFLGCWLTAAVYFSLLPFDNNIHLHVYVPLFAIYAGMCNSTLNLILLVVLDSSFKMSIKKLCTCFTNNQERIASGRCENNIERWDDGVVEIGCENEHFSI